METWCAQSRPLEDAHAEVFLARIRLAQPAFFEIVPGQPLEGLERLRELVRHHLGQNPAVLGDKKAAGAHRLEGGGGRGLGQRKAFRQFPGVEHQVAPAPVVEGNIQKLHGSG